MMFERYRLIIAWVLMVFLPLQAFASANMFICQSMMPIQLVAHTEPVAASMPCHTHHASQTIQDSYQNQSPCQSECAAICVGMCSLIAFPVNFNSLTMLKQQQVHETVYISYASVVLPNPHRPPISLI